MAVARRGETQTHPVDSARAISKLAGELAATIERDRRLPAELVDALADAGMFPLLVPRSLEGGEVQPQVLVDCVEQLARGDAATAWCVSVATTSGMLAAYLSEGSRARRLFAPRRAAGAGCSRPRDVPSWRAISCA